MSQHADNGPDATASSTTPIDAAPGETPLAVRVEAVLALIRPAVREDGGDIELVEVTDDGLVRIRFHGACVGCPSSSITLHSGIERSLRERLPAIRGVEAVAD